MFLQGQSICFALFIIIYERIPEAEEKRADWKLALGKYKILVEQKSSLLGLLAKQPEPNIDAITTLLHRQRFQW